MTKICVSLTEETTAGVVERMQELAGIADLFEVRADMVLDLELLPILRARTRPILLTCRAASEGGRLADDDPRRRLILMEAAKRGFDYVDVEYRSAFTDVMVEKAGRGLVVSYHDLKGTPEDLDGFYAAMREGGADVVKIAVTPRSIKDVGRLLDFAARTTAGGGPPLVPIALGPLGVVTRVAAGRWGAPFTFASAARGVEASPGQVPAAEMADLYRSRDVNPLTKLYGVLGTDVVWSLSPVLHNRAFEARGLDAVYVPLQVESLDGFLAAMPALALSGFSVTRPFKVDIVPHLQEVEEQAAISGSVNTVVVHEGSLRGSTTDGIGVLAPLRKRLDVKGRAVVIVGAGGAARAAAVALQRKGAKVTLVARRPERAASVARVLGCAHAGLDGLPRLTWQVLINATPVGSVAFPDQSPVPASLHRPGTVVLDMVYEPLETRFLRDAQEAGCTIIDGLEMLLAQAVAQFETWTGLEAPLDVMKSAALFLAQEQEA
jgi:3-dehydroquinate dehydratase / shikimate dehydrogenase